MLEPYAIVASAMQSAFEDQIAFAPPGKLAIEAVGALAALTILCFPAHHKIYDTAIAAIVLWIAVVLVQAW